MNQPSDQPILAMHNIAVEARESREWSVWGATFAIHPGELLLLRLDAPQEFLPIADAACGVAELAGGESIFRGKPWPAMSPREASANRARIGRSFVEGGWQSNLDVDENITLAQRHHTRRPEVEIEREAAVLSRVFGLPGLPRGRPWRMRPQDLRRAGLVRAFLGEPVLLLLDQPAKELYPDIFPALLNAVNTARKRGAAVFWTTDSESVWTQRAIRPTLRYRMSGAHMIPADEATIARTKQACPSPSNSDT